MNRSWGPIAYVTRRALRRQAWTLAVIVALCGVAVTAVFASAAIARRTSSENRRLRTWTNASDLFLLLPSQDLARTIADLPQVRRSSVLVPVALSPVGMSPDLGVLADIGGHWMRDVDRLELRDGTLPSPDDPIGVILTAGLADELQVHAGDPLTVQSISMSGAMRAAQSGDPTSVTFDGPRPELRVSAVVSVPVNDDPKNQQMLVLTRAFFQRWHEQIASFGAMLPVQLRPDISTSAFLDSVRKLPGGNEVEVDAVGQGDESAAATSLHVIALAWALLAAVLVMAGGIALAQAIARAAMQPGEDLHTLAALGMTGRVRRATVVFPILLAAVAGVAAGTVGAPLLAPHLVSGIAARLEVDPGVHVDWVVTAVGATAAVLFVSVVTLVAATSNANRPTRRFTPRTSRQSRYRRLLPVPAAAGLALAFGHHGRRVPVRQAMTSAVLGVMGITAALVFGSSIDQLRSEPALYGWSWDAAIVGDGTVSADLGDADVDASVVTTYLGAQIEHRPIPVTSFQAVSGTIDPTLVRGRLPGSPTEVLVGEKTLADLGLSLGDSATLTGPEGPVEARIVGTTVLPTIVDPTPVARGAVIDPALVTRLGLGQENGVLTAGTVVRSRGEDEHALAALAGDNQLLLPSPPAEVSRLGEVRPFPWMLAATLALLASGNVVHALVVMVRRRRRSLGVLRVLGFTGRQLSVAVLAPAAVVAVVSITTGMLLGAAAGRLGWRVLVHAMGLPFQPAIPAVGLSAALLAVAVCITAAALLPVRAARRSHGGEILRVE